MIQQPCLFLPVQIKRWIGIYYPLHRAEMGLMAKSPDTMGLGFEETQTPYTSGSQSARAWTEAWVRGWMYCPNCGSSTISPFPNNSPVADFFCASCKEEYELKSQKKPFSKQSARWFLSNQVRSFGR